MSKTNIKRASLSQLREMADKGLLIRPLSHSQGETLPPNFWADATLVKPKQQRSVHLKVDSDVFEYFKGQGKGHLTKMQDVLRAYMRAHQAQS